MVVIHGMDGSLVRPLAIEAVGDDFVQVSGAWLQGSRVARYAMRAQHAWAFAAMDDESIFALQSMLSTVTDARVVGISPGRNADWPAEDRISIQRLLGDLCPRSATVGLMLAYEKCAACDCTQCHRRNGACGKAQ